MNYAEICIIKRDGKKEIFPSVKLRMLLQKHLVPVAL